jgi:hypothetical protein
MVFYKRWVIGWLVLCVFLSTLMAEANERPTFAPEPEIVWESEPLFATWFGDVLRVGVGHDGVPADWVIVQAGKRSDLKVDVITVKYWGRYNKFPKQKKFYPYERIRFGDHIRFKLHRVDRVIGIEVKASGWGGSRRTDGFRIILKKNTRRPPLGWRQTEYFYGQCIGGRKCPGYRRTPINSFTIDLEDVVEIKRIRFFSHDRVGRSRNGKVNVYVDDRRVAQELDIRTWGSKHTLKLDSITGRYITFEAATNDEAVIQEISVDYSANWKQGRRGRTGPGNFPGGRFNR